MNKQNDTESRAAVSKSAVQRIVMRLRKHNEWRRGTDFEQPEPATIGRDIDDAISVIEQHIALTDKYNQMYSALLGLINERQPLGIDRTTYQNALKLIDE